MISSPVTFVEQAPVFLESLSKRRKLVKPATLRAYDSYLRNWILPLIGDQSLESFGNGAMKRFVGQLVAAGLGPKSITEIVTLVKQMIASAVTEDGDYLYPKVWNRKFLDLPSIANQKQPTITDEQIKLAMKDKYKVFWAFLLGSGLRIGEAQAVRIGDNGEHSAWDKERAVIIVRKSIWNRQEQAPKTPAALREVDLHPSLNQMLIEATDDANPGNYLFRNRNGGPVWLNTLISHLKAMDIHGFHTTRRFRTTHLRGVEGLPEQLIKYWLGHEMKADMTDRYSKICQNEALRKSWAIKAGLGFTLPEISKAGRPSPPSSKARNVSPASAPTTPAESPAPVESTAGVETVVEVVSYRATDEDLPIELFRPPTESLLEVE